MELLTRVEDIFGATYAIERELTGGGMSRLFVATDRELGRRVVIKILPPELTSEMMSARFRRESEITARLQHPHILPVLSAGVRDGLLFYITPFIEGESLRHRLERERQLPVREAVRLLWEVADALSYAHKLGVVHRDIKPENILIQDGHAVLADFGIAAALAGPDGESVVERLTRTGMSIGTVGYMAPEQLFGERALDGRSDIYALGVVGYEMFAGDPPFTGPTAQAVMTAHITDEPPRLDDIREDVPETAVAAIRRALRKSPDDRFQTAGELRDALDQPESTNVNFTRAFRLRKIRKHRRRLAVVVPALVVMAGAAFVGVRAWRARSAPTEYVTVAVAPFNTLDPKLALWREGLVDLMARNLDGAGTVHTVSPVVAIRDFPAVADSGPARALALRTHAQYALFGYVNYSGSDDSVHVRGTLIDMTTNRSVSFERRAATVDALAEQLTFALLEEIAKSHRIGATRHVSLGTTSLPALRAFLQGEQFYRRTSWDSAAVLYKRAVALDTTFPLALRRAAEVVSWNGGESDSLARAYWLRAGVHNRRLSRRDSLLVAADSLRAALSTVSIDSLDWSKATRLFALLGDAVARYPDDPEVWYALGEARFHHGYGSLVSTSDREVLDAFDRSLALDSSFAPAYVHAIELAFTLDGEAKGRRYSQNYLAHNPTDASAESIRLLDRMLARRAADPGSLDAMADSVTPTALYNAWVPVRRWPDSAETALRILRSLERRQTQPAPGAPACSRVCSDLAVQLAYLGRMREAYQTVRHRPSRFIVELALFGAIPDDTAAAIYAEWRAARAPQAFHFMPWLSAHGDTAALLDLQRTAASMRDSGTRVARRSATYEVAAAGAYLALARRDSAGALAKFVALPDTLCIGCYMDRWTAARLLASAGRFEEAEPLLAQRLYTFMTPAEIWILAEHGRVAIRAGRPEIAADSWQRLVRAWSTGDPSVQPLVAAARKGLATLAAH